MLSATERRRIDALLAKYPTASTASIDALMVVQEERGWVSDEALADVAGALDMTIEELESVATFYNRVFRKPVGRYVISVCDSISCYLMGGERLLLYLEKRLGIRAGQTTPDGMFTLLPNVCLGHCEKAPAMLVGHEVHGHLTEERVDRILAELAGRPAASPQGPPPAQAAPPPGGGAGSRGPEGGR